MQAGWQEMKGLFAVVCISYPLLNVAPSSESKCAHFLAINIEITECV